MHSGVLQPWYVASYYTCLLGCSSKWVYIKKSLGYYIVYMLTSGLIFPSKKTGICHLIQNNKGVEFSNNLLMLVSDVKITSYVVNPRSSLWLTIQVCDP